MPDYKPLPMKDTVNPQPMHPASEKMSQWMNSYMPTVMNKIMAGSVGPTNMGMGNQGAGISDMLFKAIHPDTFERVLNLLRPEPKEPIPRQGGGPVDPNKDYVVGEKGRPEIFRPNVPGDIIPGPGGGQLRYAGQNVEGGIEPLGATGSYGRPGATGDYNQSWVSPYMNPHEPGLPGFELPSGGGELGVGKFLREAPGLAGEAYRGIAGEVAPLGSTTARFPVEEGRGIPGQTGGVALGSEGGGLANWGITKETLPLGETRYTLPGTEGTMTLPAGWNAAEEGQKYMAGMKEGRIYGGYPSHDVTPLPAIPERSYYDAHPEEKAAQDVYDRLHPNMYDRTMTRKQREAREVAANKGYAETYGKAMEYSPTSPKSQEELARAEYYRKMPETKEAIAAMQAEEKKRPYALPGGYWDPAKGGFVPQAKMTNEETWQSHIMQTIPHAMQQAAASGVSFNQRDFMDESRMAFGLPPIKWPKQQLPDYATFKRRSAGSKMSEKELQAAYAKLKKEEAQ